MTNAFRNFCFFAFSISLFASCTYKEKQAEHYGDFTVEQVDKLRRRPFWKPEHLDSYNNLYFKDEEVDIESLAERFIEDKLFRDVKIIEARPFLTDNGKALYLFLTSDKMGYEDSVLNARLCILKKEKGDLSLITLLRINWPSGQWEGLYKMDSVDNKRVFIDHYILNEETFGIEKELPLAKECEGDLDYSEKDSTKMDTVMICRYATTFYGVSPDKKWLVHSFEIHELTGNPQLYITDLESGASKIFSLNSNGQPLEELFNYDYVTDGARQWFQRNFKWVKGKDGYELKINLNN
ncbi:hypothetical protein WSM22_35580 [Cytophagales bacterium WSM2-2]|nr:hypothetical protein WSM22_35580 [Cytophagales bacterium WSM2-2]